MYGTKLQKDASGYNVLFLIFINTINSFLGIENALKTGGCISTLSLLLYDYWTFMYGYSTWLCVDLKTYWAFKFWY